MSVIRGRKPLEDRERRNRRLATYVTAAEEAAALKLAAEGGYHGIADVLRHGLQLLVTKKSLDRTIVRD